MNDRDQDRRALLLLAFAGVAAVLSGCAEDFDPATLILEPRVIGTVLEVEGDPERAVAAPGEAFTARWVVAQPALEQPFTWLMAACVARPSPVGRPFCIAAPYFATTDGEPGTEAPEARIEVPADLDTDSEVLLLGVLCREGVPDVTAFASPTELDVATVCTAGEGQILAQSIRVIGDAGNHRPFWPADPVRVDGDPWPSDCLAVDEDGLELSFVGMEAVDREEVQVLTSDVPPETLVVGEALLISHHTTAGEVERQFGIIDDDETLEPFDWLPTDLTERTTVRFYFGLRDQRGGADFLVRELCVDPVLTP